MMKKRYTTPEVEIIYLATEPIMGSGSITGGFDEDLPMDPDDQGAGGHRGDWENIWKNM